MPNGYYGQPYAYQPPYGYGYQAPPPVFSPPGSYYDNIYGVYKPFPGGGVPVRVDYNNRCSRNYVGIKPHPDQQQYYYVCQPNCVIFSKCPNLESFNSSRGRCVDRVRSDNPPRCQQEGRFRHPYDCKVYYRCDKNQSTPWLFGCPSGTIFSSFEKKCIPGDECPSTQISNSGSYIPENCEAKFPECREEGTFRSPSDCALYYTCKMQENGNYLQTRFKCPGSNSYDTQRKLCRPENEVRCQDYVRIAELAYAPVNPYYSYLSQSRTEPQLIPFEDDDETLTEIKTETKETNKQSVDVPKEPSVNIVILPTSPSTTSKTTTTTTKAPTTTREYPTYPSYPSYTYGYNYGHHYGYSAESLVKSESSSSTEKSPTTRRQAFRPGVNIVVLPSSSAPITQETTKVTTKATSKYPYKKYTYASTKTESTKTPDTSTDSPDTTKRFEFDENIVILPTVTTTVRSTSTSTTSSTVPTTVVHCSTATPETTKSTPKPTTTTEKTTTSTEKTTPKPRTTTTAAAELLKKLFNVISTTAKPKMTLSELAKHNLATSKPFIAQSLRLSIAQLASTEKQTKIEQKASTTTTETPRELNYSDEDSSEEYTDDQNETATEKMEVDEKEPVKDTLETSSSSSVPVMIMINATVSESTTIKRVPFETTTRQTTTTSTSSTPSTTTSISSTPSATTSTSSTPSTAEEDDEANQISTQSSVNDLKTQKDMLMNLLKQKLSHNTQSTTITIETKMTQGTTTEKPKPKSLPPTKINSSNHSLESYDEDEDEDYEYPNDAPAVGPATAKRHSIQPAESNGNVLIATTPAPCGHNINSTTTTTTDDYITEKVPELILKVYEPVDLKIVFCPRTCDEDHDHKFDPADSHKKSSCTGHDCIDNEPPAHHSVDLKWKPLTLKDTVGFQTIT
ncbi:uncharacterized protein Dwil_GK14674 [Drosophila willistoni]|uniref:Chitin-binding type-2 domain-containing protein n=1 Tax=Drosophila willistoni TaxID=7260 RepID=B4NPR5_DROWI|nr:uncharacterized protein Dwil_GK14674 [Drosophila willistoni]